MKSLFIISVPAVSGMISAMILYRFLNRFNGGKTGMLIAVFVILCLSSALPLLIPAIRDKPYIMLITYLFIYLGIIVAETFFPVRSSGWISFGRHFTSTVVLILILPVAAANLIALAVFYFYKYINR